MTDQQDRAAPTVATPATVTRYAVQRVRALRKERRLSAQALADRCTEPGQSIERSVIANLECGRRTQISVDELYAFAKALDVPAVDLLPPEPPEPATPAEVLRSVVAVFDAVRRELEGR